MGRPPVVTDPYPEEIRTLARVGRAFAVVKAARVLVKEPADDTCWFRLEDAIDALDALDTANHREHSVSERLGQ